MKLKLRTKNEVTVAGLTRELKSAWRSLLVALFRSYAVKLAESMREDAKRLWTTMEIGSRINIKHT